MRCEAEELFVELSLRVAGSPEGDALCAARAAGESLQLRGIRGAYLSFLLYGLHARDGGVSVVVCESAEAAAYFFSDLASLLDSRHLLYFPSSFKGGDRLGVENPEGVIQRNDLISRQQDLAGDVSLIVITYIEALAERIVAMSAYDARVFSVEVGDASGPECLVDSLEDLGFARVDLVVEPGQYARRGSIVDVYSYDDNLPYRVDYLDREVDSIRQFDVDTQLSVGKVLSCTVTPSFSSGESEVGHTLLELLGARAVVWTADWQAGLQAYAQQRAVADEALIPRLADVGEIQAALARVAHFQLGLGDVEEVRRTVVFHSLPHPNFARNFQQLVATIREEYEMGRKVYIFSEQTSQVLRLEAIFRELGLGDECYGLVSLPLHQGFVDSSLGLNVYTDHQIFDRYHRYKLRKAIPKRGAFTLRELEALQPGDYVVHVDHGIGRFEGFVRGQDGRGGAESVCVSYGDGDTLLVSVHNLHRLSKYRGQEGEEPRVHKLGSGVWSRLKQKVKGQVKEMARDLIRLYASRRVEKGYAFSADTYMQEELEASFLFQDTPDQLSATRDVKADMESEAPMDRLICGDVGFGKTEIAVRAAFKAVADSKQVCVLVPTTVLALQHYKTFSARLADFPCRVDFLSRLRTSKQTREVMRDVAEGRVDILIGTHAILRKDLIFKDLGLLIVDEEQKFGVAAKEKIKQVRQNVDTLTLTATPIPRTLQFSLMGARDMSIISTPPPNRYPIHTEVMLFDRARLAEAIRYEMNRGGQVFFVHNWVQNLSHIQRIVEEMVPGVRCVMAHGQMKPAEIEQVMLDFMAGEFDVLLCTSIVEAGLDIPNANTIIINNGHRFGLSDLHQLRGRVGRTNRRAYCYIVIPTTEALSEGARRRLKAIEDFSDLGSGMSISMQDLDIRGAGNLLGAQQSGFIVDMGMETYQRILDEAIRELKVTEFAELFQEEVAADAMGIGRDCIVETDMDISLPPDYVENPSERIRLYREIDRVKDAGELEQFISSLRDRFGVLPAAAESLMGIPPLKWAAAGLGVEKLQLKQGGMHLSFVTPVDSPYYQGEVFGRVLRNVQREPGRFRLRQTETHIRLDVTNVYDVAEGLHMLSMLNARGSA